MIKALEQGATHRAIIEWPELTGTGQVDAIAEEVPVALIYNGISHAVMMASPVNLAPFGLGFCHSKLFWLSSDWTFRPSGWTFHVSGWDVPPSKPF